METSVNDEARYKDKAFSMVMESFLVDKRVEIDKRQNFPDE